jgi:hypothetical protein
MSVYAFPVPHMRKIPHSDLELKFIKEYIKRNGFSYQDLQKLPDDEAHLLIGKACLYATLRLTEIASKENVK